MTILNEALAFIREDRGYTSILGIYFSDWEITVVFKPMFIWSSWFFSLWMYKRIFRSEIEISLDTK